MNREVTLQSAIDALPRVSLGERPTPLEALPRLSAALGGPPLYIKRDDLTGLAFGGNKTRMLEFSLADALVKGALIGDIRAGKPPSDEPVLFLHTGGAPALFGYADDLLASMPG